MKFLGKYNSLIALLKAFPDEETCVRHFEKLRWPSGIVCPLCGSARQIYRVKRGHGYKCADCRKPLSVRKGTIFERKPFTASNMVCRNLASHESPQGHPQHTACP